MLETFIEIGLNTPDDFLKVKETLTRIGIANHDNSQLSQTCHILHKRGKYYIVHFLQMFQLDGKPTHFGDDDAARLHYIVSMLEKWRLVNVLSSYTKSDTRASGVTIVPHRDKLKWTLVQKYTIGK